MSECKYCKAVKEENMSDNALQLISTIKELHEIHEFMEDEQLDRCLELVIKLIVKQGEIPAIQAVPRIVELQALSTKFALMSVKYATFDAGSARSEKAHKKNVYYTLRTAIDKLVDALKITVKYGLET